MEEIADPEFLCGDQTVFVVIDIEGSFRFEADQSLARRPVLRPHFQISDIECVHDSIDMPVEAGLPGFHRHPGLMSVCQDSDPLTEGAHTGQKFPGIGQKINQVGEFIVHGHHIHADSPAPVIQIGPFQVTFDGTIHRHQTVASLLKRKVLLRRVATRKLFFEENIIEVPVEQCPIHIEQDIIDMSPEKPAEGNRR